MRQTTLCWFLIATILLAACGAESTVMSSDGVLSMTLSASALPNGISAEDIRIERTSDTQYELLPDGLTLKKPVLITFAPKDQSAKAPFFVHVGKDGLELVDVSRAIEPSKDTTTFQISHFSKLQYGGGDACNMVMQLSPAETLVGGRLRLHSTFTRTNQSTVLFPDRKNNREYEVTYVQRLPSVHGHIWTQGMVLGPSRVADLPETRPMTELQISQEQEFTCARYGGARVFHEYTLDYYARIKTFTTDAAGNRTGPPTEEYDNVECGIYKGIDTACLRRASPSSVSSSLAPGQHREVCLVIDKERYPSNQFRRGYHADGCDDEHWHADFLVASLEGGVREDPEPHNCGFGRTSDLPQVTCILDQATWERFQQAGERAR